MVLIYNTMALNFDISKPQTIALYIDHTLLKPEATKQQIRSLCEEALDHHFYSVCVNSWIAFSPENDMSTSAGAVIPEKVS